MSSKKVEGKEYQFNNMKYLYIWQIRKALNRLEESMKSSCDRNKASEQQEPSAFINLEDTTLSDETDPEGEFIQAYTSRTPDMHDLKKDKKINDIKVMSGGSKRIESGSDSSDSEDNINDKRAERREKKLSMSKLKEKNLSTSHREDTTSSFSSKVQKSKTSHVGSKVIKKLAQTPKLKPQTSKQKSVLSSDSNSESLIDEISTKRLSNRQNIFFKSGINKIMSQLQELHFYYEVEMDSINCKYLKKNIQYYDLTEKVFKKLVKMIEDMKNLLDEQEDNLINFYEDWEKNYRADYTEHEDSSSSKAEESKAAENKKESEKLKNVPEASLVVSACNDEVFPGNETQTTTEKSNKSKVENLPTITETSRKDDSDQVGAAPIVANTNVADKTLHETDLTEQAQLAEENRDQEQTSRDYLASDIITLDVSSNTDIYDDTTVEIITSSPEIRDASDNESGTDITLDLMINKRKRKRKNSCDSVKGVSWNRRIDSVSNTLDKEERAKKALLVSVSESDTTSNIPVNDTTAAVESSVNDNLTRTDSSKTEEPDKKMSKYNKKQNETKNTSSEDLTEIMESKSVTVRTFLESDIDGSSTPILKKRLKKKVHSIVISEDSSCDDNDSNSNGEKQNSLKKGKNKNKRRSSSIEDHGNSSKDSNFDVDSELIIEKRYFLRKKNTESKKDSTSLRIILNKKLKNLIKSDSKVFSGKVVLRRLSESLLSKHNNALDKSRKYLETKEFQNLSNLDSLRRTTRSMSSSFGSSNVTPLYRSPKSKSKEAEEMLLDHLKIVKDGISDETVENDTVSDPERDSTFANLETSVQSNEDSIEQADAVKKKMLLHSSGSDARIEEKTSSESDEEKNKNNSRNPAKRQSAKLTQEDEKRKKSRWRRHKLLTMKFTSDSDSDVVTREWDQEKKKLAEIAETDQAEDFEKSNDSVVKHKQRTRHMVIDSDD